MEADDRKMFAPLRQREAVSPASKVCAMLLRYTAGTMPAELAQALVHNGFAVGTRARVTKRVGEVLDALEQEGKVERIPDGRYRVARLSRDRQRG
jgi:hypothetical protein